MARERPGRILLKVSGELLSGFSDGVYDDRMITSFCRDIKKITEEGVQVSLLVGGGNILRGSEMERLGLGRVPSDQAGMMATIVNSIILQNWLTRFNIMSQTFSSIPVGFLVAEYVPQRALELIEKGGIPVLAGGTGNTYFTTDTAAILRSIELNVDVMVKGTKVRGLYDGDPMRDPSANFIPHIDYQSYLDNRYGVMDMTAVMMAMQYRMPIIVFNIFELGNLCKVVMGEEIGTYIS
ncbi:MAG: UMP kinase [Candidatus Coatesbacteria bacterium]|nr:MAG: UMP kinase [Candidatus Coatesbacteria bacterium]RLC44460.1 MAG: UMP kinase [Candidatus Coatesbacteria bacterium]